MPRSNCSRADDETIPDEQRRHCGAAVRRPRRSGRATSGVRSVSSHSRSGFKFSTSRAFGARRRAMCKAMRSGTFSQRWRRASSPSTTVRNVDEGKYLQVCFLPRRGPAMLGAIYEGHLRCRPVCGSRCARTATASATSRSVVAHRASGSSSSRAMATSRRTSPSVASAGEEARNTSHSSTSAVVALATLRLNSVNERVPDRATARRPTKAESLLYIVRLYRTPVDAEARCERACSRLQVIGRRFPFVGRLDLLLDDRPSIVWLDSPRT